LGDELLVVDGFDVVALDTSNTSVNARSSSIGSGSKARVRKRGDIERNYYAMKYAERQKFQLRIFSTHFMSHIRFHE